MRPWKVMAGLGAACAACCAIPLLGLGGGAAVVAGVSVFASALWACAGELLPAALVLVVVAAAWAGLRWGQRRRAARSGTCGCATSCPTGAGQGKG